MLVSVDTLGFDAINWRVYDHAAKSLRTDVVWADELSAQIGVCKCNLGIGEVFSLLIGCDNVRIEQRKSIMVVTALKWISVDTPAGEVMGPYTIPAYGGEKEKVR